MVLRTSAILDRFPNSQHEALMLRAGTGLVRDRAAQLREEFVLFGILILILVNTQYGYGFCVFLHGLRVPAGLCRQAATISTFSSPTLRSPTCSHRCASTCPSYHPKSLSLLSVHLLLSCVMRFQAMCGPIFLFVIVGLLLKPFNQLS